MSTTEQRALWRQRATWLTQAGLAEEEGAPVAVAEELAGAVHALLDEVQALEQDLRVERATRPRSRGWPR
jgi:hypothetical protein